MKKYAGLALFLILWCSGVSALEIPGKTSYKLNDYAGVISSEAKPKIEQALVDFKKSNNAELIVTILPSLEGMDFGQFVSAYTPKWRRMWPFENDRRIHFIIVIGDKKMRMGVGMPLSKRLTRQKTDFILNQIMKPYFAQDEYARGIRIGIEAVQAVLKAK